ncbi:UDP-N-acetylglucosamine--N-acetylmuramyl-(pentapeptide) pyrophosphoryl-undecaprenol N-acetylglucosamine transferase [Patescibacteria group bacterium]|mgnify:CR=1 FL=1|nr:UDP-N-acetylglucosamine--N-acetylmuramyl-(pentapeptide) pyrophosphoryl-undecaprenol N-acetylglucosamine transferase [Patescibacteria group bacterium]
MKVLISGGHLTPALAVIDYARQHFPDDQFIFAGRIYSQPTLKQRSWEKQEVSKRGVTFVPFNAPKLDGQPVWKLPLTFIDLLAAIHRSRQLLAKYKPDLFFSFGGFLGLPFAIAAKTMGIPVLTHEQTRTGGVANQWISKFATAVAISFPESEKYFPAKKVRFTGNPLRQSLFTAKPKTPAWLPSAMPTKPLLYITGGNQGSQCINILVQEALPSLLEDWWIIHQCGSPTNLMNYKKSLEKTRSNLPIAQQHLYFVREWVTEEELSWIYQHASSVLTRSGANTVSELIAVGLPALFIPLPQAHHDEQRLNAEVMADAGAGLILSQREASAETLIDALKIMKKKHKALKRHAVSLQEAIPENPTAKLYELAQSVAQT